MKKICLDNIVFSLQKTGGVSIVWYELLKRLLQSEYGDELSFIEYDNAGGNIFRQKLSLSSSDVMMRDSHLLSFQRYLNPRVCNNERFLFHSSYYRTYFTFDIGNKSFFKEVITSDIYEGRVINNNSALAFAAPKEYTKDMNEMLEYFNYIFDYEKYFSLSISWLLLIFSISLIISMWLIFKKLGEKGWKSIIPIYNLWCLSRLTLGSPWYSLFIFIPFFNVIMILTLFYCLGRRFERKRLYCVALMFFPTVVLPLLAFSFKDEEVNNN